MFSQSTAVVEGKVTDLEGNSIVDANISIIGYSTGAISGIDGSYNLRIPAEKQIEIAVTHISYNSQQQDLIVGAGDTATLNFQLTELAFDLEGVEIEEEQNRQNSLQKVDPKDIKFIPSPSGDFEAIIKTLPGVSSTNELTSQYNVRGGNFDENLVYVNDIEIYRPFLIRSGEQEGLSFINSDLIEDIYFSAGGFAAKYGDKMSSVLDVTYKEPEEFGATVTGSLQGGSISFEGSSDNKRLTYLTGVRYRSNQYILSSLDTEGDYKPSFADVQTYLTYDITEKWEIGFLGNYAKNKYIFQPETRQTNFGTIQQALRLTVYFDGQEVDEFETFFGAVSNTFTPKPGLELKLITSAFQSIEKETFDIRGQYYIDELERDLGSENFGDVAFNRGIGTYMNHARNSLDAVVFNVEHLGKKVTSNGKLQWGIKYQHEDIRDQLSEWDIIDSAGYSLPQPPSTPGKKPVFPLQLDLYEVFKAENHLSSNRLSGFVQKSRRWKDEAGQELTATAGIRANYWDFNGETVLSPRASISFLPNWERDFLFRFSSGFYYQPPFYRELRDFDGELNKNIEAQRSIHFVLGADYNFTAWNRPFKFVGEAYYKKMDNIIPYEIDNVRIRYFAENSAEAYAAGLDFKINGEFVKGVQSWISIGIMNVQEDIKNDHYYTYYNSDGEEIIPGYTFNSTPIDSIKTTPGHIPRPSDQRFNFSLFFQDYFPNKPDLKMHMTFHYGSGLPFGPPSRIRYKDTLRMPAYLRVDLGFSKQLMGKDSKLKENSPFRHFESIWIGLECFNLLQRNNIISYLWVTDVTNRQYAVPNYLTGRQLNLKVQFKF